jgi:hypothetical protein
MKKLVLIALSVFAMNISFGQQSELMALNLEHPKKLDTHIEEEPEHSIVNAKNSYYLEMAKVQSSSVVIRQMQKEAADYNVKNSPIYDNSEKATYLVIFKNKGNKLIARYDRNGKILSTTEHYKNIALPPNLKVVIAKKYPGWEFIQNSCHFSYDRSKGLHKNIKLQLKQGKSRKTLKIIG